MCSCKTSMAEDIVTLNVGGTVYATTRSTLCKYPDSMLGAMMSGKFPSTVDKNGHYFIDRDGDIFRFVLNFLRSSKLALPADFKDFDLLQVEADFYQINPLIEAICMLKGSCLDGGTVHYMEIIEVRTGSTATMPTNNSRVKTIISGQKDAILSISPELIGYEATEKMQNKNGPEFAELELNGSNVRLRIGEFLRNSGWELISSNFCSSAGYDAKSLVSSLIIEQSYRDRWSLALPVDVTLSKSTALMTRSDSYDERNSNSMM